VRSRKRLLTVLATGSAMVGGGVALLSAEAGASHLAVLFGALAGIAAGAIAETIQERGKPYDTAAHLPDPRLRLDE